MKPSQSKVRSFLRMLSVEGVTSAAGGPERAISDEFCRALEALAVQPAEWETLQATISPDVLVALSPDVLVDSVPGLRLEIRVRTKFEENQ